MHDACCVLGHRRRQFDFRGRVARMPARTRCIVFGAIGLLVVACGGGGGGASVPSALATGVQQSSANTSATVPATVLDGRVIAGYQAWFGCPGDFDGNTQWIHWFDGTADPARLTVDMFPDVSGLPASSLCDTGLAQQGGATLKVYSAMDPALVDLQFAQMAAHGVGAVALQRFVNQLQAPQLERRVNRVLDNAVAAAQRHQLPLYITYDVSGADPATVLDRIRRDWADLNTRYAWSTNAAYLRNAGRPVLQIWGFGFTDRPGDPAAVLQLLADLQKGAIAPAAFLIGGVPSRWSSLDGDSKTDPAWAAVYRQYDVLSPWTVGRYASEADAATYITQTEQSQRALAAANGQGLLPVVFPGFSDRNLAALRGVSAPLNQIPRDCGRFMRAQLQQVAANGGRSIYVAMYDEVDEGTAMLPTLASASQVPAGVRAVTLDADGCALAADFYLGLLDAAAGAIR